MKTIDEASARRLAVKADCDPRTIKKVLKGLHPTRSLSARRAKIVLIEAGLINGSW